MKKIADKLIKTGAVVFDFGQKGDFPLLTVNSSILLEKSSVRSLFTSSLIKLLDRNDLEADIILGYGNSGISFASMIAFRLSLPMAYIRNAAKDHGKKNRIEGKIEKKSNAVIFIDSVYDEAVLDEAREAAEGAECHVIGFITIYSAIEHKKVFALTNFEEIKKRAVKKGYISRYDFESLKEENAAEKHSNDVSQKAASILLNIKAVTLSSDNPFRYASGILSPVYCDNRLLISYPDEWLKVINYMIDIIQEKIGVNNFDIVSGTASAGIPHGTLIADILGKPFIYIKSEVTGNIPEKNRVLIVEDLISTGKSSGEAVDVVRQAGGIVTDCISIFTYEMKKAADIFKEKKCRVFSVSCFSDLVKTASQKKYIKQKDIEKICEWNSDPENWGKKYGFEN